MESHDTGVIYIIRYLDKNIHDRAFLSIEKVKNWAEEYWEKYNVNINMGTTKKYGSKKSSDNKK